MEYAYFVSYAFPNGFGRCEVRRSTEITTFAEIAAIEKGISDGQVTSVVVIGYQLIGTKNIETTEHAQAEKEILGGTNHDL